MKYNHNEIHSQKNQFNTYFSYDTDQDLNIMYPIPLYFDYSLGEIDLFLHSYVNCVISEVQLFFCLCQMKTVYVPIQKILDIIKKHTNWYISDERVYEFFDELEKVGLLVRIYSFVHATPDIRGIILCNSFDELYYIKRYENILYEQHYHDNMLLDVYDLQKKYQFSIPHDIGVYMKVSDFSHMINNSNISEYRVNTTGLIKVRVANTLLFISLYNPMIIITNIQMFLEKLFTVELEIKTAIQQLLTFSENLVEDALADKSNHNKWYILSNTFLIIIWRKLQELQVNTHKYKYWKKVEWMSIILSMYYDNLVIDVIDKTSMINYKKIVTYLMHQFSLTNENLMSIVRYNEILKNIEVLCGDNYGCLYINFQNTYLLPQAIYRELTPIVCIESYGYIHQKHFFAYFKYLLSQVQKDIYTVLRQRFAHKILQNNIFFLYDELMHDIDIYIQKHQGLFYWYLQHPYLVYEGLLYDRIADNLSINDESWKVAYSQYFIINNAVKSNFVKFLPYDILLRVNIKNLLYEACRSLRWYQQIKVYIDGTPFAFKYQIDYFSEQSSNNYRV